MGLKKELEIDELAPTTVTIGGDDDESESSDDTSESSDGVQEKSQSATSGKDAPPRISNASRGNRGGSPDRPSRNGKWESLQRSLKDANEQNSRFTKELSELRSTVEQLRSASTPQQAASAQNTADKQMTDIVGQMNHLVDMAGAEGLSAAQRNQLSIQYQELQDKRQNLQWEQREAKLRESIREEIVGRLPGGGNQQVASFNAVLNQEFPEVMGNEYATNAARGYYQFLVASGRQDGLPALREACAHVASQMGLGAPQQSPRARAPYQGVPGTRNAGGGGGRSVTLSARDKVALKQAMNSGIPEEYLQRAIAGDFE